MNIWYNIKKNKFYPFEPSEQPGYNQAGLLFFQAREINNVTILFPWSPFSGYNKNNPLHVLD